MPDDEPNPIDRLDPRLVAAVRRRGIAELTEIQRLALPLLHGTSDALLISPTGTGKTEAALLPLLSRQLKDPSPPISLLYITPLRALNRDLAVRLTELCQEVGLVAAVRHGDTPAGDRLRQARKPADLLLTTPETLQLLLVGKRLREGLRGVRAVIVDEVHELAPSDRGAQLALTLERLEAFAGHPIRRVGLSATVGNPEHVARFLSPEPRVVEIRSALQKRHIVITPEIPPPGPPPVPAPLAAELKADAIQLGGLVALEAAVRAHTTTLIFVNTRPTAEGLAVRLARLAPDLTVAVHHGSLSREMREEAEEAFRSGKLRALVATSSLELGLDIGHVDLVIQFGSPHQAGRLLQRVGRSGHRLGREVRGIVLSLDEEDLEEAAVLARRAVAVELEPIVWRTRNRLAVGQQIVAALRANGVIDAKETAAIFRRTAPASEIDDDEWEELMTSLAELGSLRQEAGRLAPGRATLHRFYETLSLIPDERTYRLRDIATRRVIGTLDERFVLTQVVARPDGLFLLHGRTWKVVEYRDGELLVETVAEIGQEPRWVGEDLPVPFEVAQEIGQLRRTRDLGPYHLSDEARRRLEARLAQGAPPAVIPDDRTITVTPQGRLAVYGACFGTRTNDTLALVTAATLTERLGARVEVVAVEPTWFVLGLPVAVDGDALGQALATPPESLEGMLRQLVPTGVDYRWVFLTVARKLGLLPASADPRDLRTLEPLLERTQGTPLGEEALEKTLHERYDVAHARAVLEDLRDGRRRVRLAPPGPWSDGPVGRLRWHELPDTPPPTLLKAIEERLRKEELTLVCLRCGFTRTTTSERYRSEGGSRCALCHGALSGVFSPRRTKEIDSVAQYAKRKWKGKRTAKAATERITPIVRQAYTSAELVAHHGERALWCLAARGVGPDTARRLLQRLYRSDAELLTELLKAERSYARTRSFWD
jgi:ATP-dependent Lhr-like helicase